MTFSSRLVGFTACMTALAVGLSALAVPFVLGLRIHFFQVAIMLAGVIGGPLSGLVTGAIGGAYVAMLRSDPTIVIGNGLLGLFTGLLVRKMRPALAGIAAWVLIQAPWMYLTGTFIFHVPALVMQTILALLTIEDVACAIVADVLQSRFHLREMVFPKPASPKHRTNNPRLIGSFLLVTNLLIPASEARRNRPPTTSSSIRDIYQPR